MKNDWERTTNISLISVGLWFCQCRRLNWINIFTNIHVGFDGRWQNVYLFDSKRSRVESFRCCQTKFNNFRSGHRNSEAWKTLGKMIFKILFSNLYFFFAKNCYYLHRTSFRVIWKMLKNQWKCGEKRLSKSNVFIWRPSYRIKLTVLYIRWKIALIQKKIWIFHFHQDTTLQIRKSCCQQAR